MFQKHNFTVALVALVAIAMVGTQLNSRNAGMQSYDSGYDNSYVPDSYDTNSYDQYTTTVKRGTSYTDSYDTNSYDTYTDMPGNTGTQCSVFAGTNQKFNYLMMLLQRQEDALSQRNPDVKGNEDYLINQQGQKIENLEDVFLTTQTRIFNMIDDDGCCGDGDCQTQQKYDAKGWIPVVLEPLTCPQDCKYGEEY